MWMALTSGLAALASASADDAGKVISDGVPENIQPADAGIPDFDGKLPTPEQLLEMLDSMTGISDEDKLSLKEDLLKNIQERATSAQTLAGDDITTQTLMLLALLSLVALIFVFFIYKLFKCLKEREAKREEKKKNKQLKKKK